MTSIDDRSGLINTNDKYTLLKSGDLDTVKDITYRRYLLPLLLSQAGLAAAGLFITVYVLIR
ncbi:MAG: hypothetical protein WBF33_29045 [Candidatus Nitrosopolaris sp.]|jgi:hypothetical protein